MASTCRSHEELRGGEIWVVDCHGRLQGQIGPMQNGKYHYKSNSHRFSSRDRKVDRFYANIGCDERFIFFMAKCLELPHFYVWCANGTTLAAICDTEFPRYAGERLDMFKRMKECLPTNTSMQVQTPIRAENVLAIEKYENEEGKKQLLVLSVACTTLCCCFICQLKGKGKNYQRV